MSIEVSVIIPFYKTIDCVEETLDSIVNQKKYNLDNLEVIVVNDGEIFKIDHIITKYKAKIKNLKYYVKPNGNWGSVINYVKHNKLATGNYITILDSDDIFHKKLLMKIRNKVLLKKYELIITSFYLWNSKRNMSFPAVAVLQIFNHKVWPRFKLISPSSLPIGKFYRSDVFYALPDLKEKISFQDIFMHNECLKKITDIYYFSKCYSYHRTDRVNNSTNTGWSDLKLQTWTNSLDYLQANNAAIVTALYCIFMKSFAKEYKKKYGKKYLIKEKIRLGFTPITLFWLFKYFILIFFCTKFTYKPEK